MKTPMDAWNALSDKVVGAEVEMLLKPLGKVLANGAVYICHVLTDITPLLGQLA
jgi:hypothetical protein